MVGLGRVRSAGDALADLAQTADELRDVAILWVIRHTPQIPDDIVRVARFHDPAHRPDVLHHRPIGLQRPRACEEAIGDQASLNALVLVIVRRDEAGHHDRARAVDYFGVGSGDVRRNLGDRLAVDQDVGLLEVTHPCVETKDDAPTQ